MEGEEGSKCKFMKEGEVDLEVKSSQFVKENKGKLKDNYRIGKLIGSGAFGDI
jgi:hypothetical protein